jgi:hypothetical protein
VSRCVGLAVYLALAVPAAAATFASGPVSATVALTVDARVQCLVTNLGTKAVRVREASAVNVDGEVVTLALANCAGESLAPGATCALATATGVLSGAIRLDVQGSVKGLRGSCKLVDGGTVYDESDFR